MRLTIEQQHMLKEVKEKIQDIKIAMVTTRYNDESLIHSRPMMVAEFDEVNAEVWFFTYANSEKAYEINESDEINLSFADAGKGLFLSVSGFGEIVKDRQKMTVLWSKYMEAWMPEGLDNPQTSLLKVNIIEAEYWDRTGNKIVQLFKMAKALVTGTQADTGKHKKVDLQAKNRSVTS